VEDEVQLKRSEERGRRKEKKSGKGRAKEAVAPINKARLVRD
jgi:hypothetical protein